MNTKLITTINGLVALLTNTMVFYWAIYFTDIGLNGLQIGTILAASEITGIIFITVGGLLNDRLKSKVLISIGLLLLITQFLSLSQTKDFTVILMLFILGGLAGSLYKISRDSLLLKTSTGETQQKKIGLFLSLGWLGGATGLIIGGQILETMQFNLFFKIIAISYVMILLISFLLPKTKIEKPKLVEYKKDLLRKEVLFFILMIFLFATHFGAESTSYGLFLKNNLNLSMKGMGLYMGSAVSVMAISVIYFSYLIRKKENVKWMLYLGILASGIGFIAMTLTNNVMISLIWRAIHELGDTAMFVFLYYGLTKFFPVGRLGGNTSIITLTTMLGASLSALTFGPLGENFGYHVPLRVSGAICILAFFIALYQRKLLKHE